MLGSPLYSKLQFAYRLSCQSGTSRFFQLGYLSLITTTLASGLQTNSVKNCNAYVPVSFLRSAHLSFFCINTLSASEVTPFSQCQNLLSIPRCISSFGQRSFSYCVPKIWNELPLSVRQSPSLHTFKRNLKTHYFADN